MTTLERLADQRDELLRVTVMRRGHNLRVFGSVARGEDGPGSDIDFLVEFDPQASLLDLIALQQDLEAIVGRRTDVVTPNSISPFLRDRILSEARSL